ncbi:MAG: substrate-binding domain-containing protein [Oscillospiraceae bacterium]|nr:substrate-binding domain-containing protein [Oscillospiraceae bacterium]
MKKIQWIKSKTIIAIALAAVLVLALGLTACNMLDGENANTEIAVINREEGSGTRGAFVELFGVEVKNEDGTKTDRSYDRAEIMNNTAGVITSVTGNSKAIGYISLGSLNDTVKALSIDGVEATSENIANGSYKIQRPFNVVTKGELSGVAQDFMDFIMSREGQEVVTERGYIALEGMEKFESNSPEGKVFIDGSSSVSPLMEKLAETYMTLNTNADVQINESDSSVGVQSAINGSCDIGMASRDLKDDEKAQGVSETQIATDGIAVIVNKENSIENASIQEIMNIYLGELRDWSSLNSGE